MNLTLLLLSHLQTAAAETPPADVDHGWVYMSLHDRTAAQAVAAALLASDDTQLDAHNLYIDAWMLDDQLVQQYRAWQEADPDAPHRRIALTMAISSGSFKAGAWCDEVESLLDGLAQDGDDEQQFWALRSRLKMQRKCTRQDNSTLEQLLVLGERYPDAALYGLHVRIQRGLIDAALVADLRRQVETEPAALRSTTALWADDISDSDRWVRRARSAALKAARSHMGSDDAVVLSSVMRVLSQAGDADSEEVMGALRTQMGQPAEASSSSSDGTVTAGDIHVANRAPSAEIALKKLDALSPQLPADGPLRSTLEELRAERLDMLGQTEAALAAIKRAWNAAPDDPAVANAYAWRAAEYGVELESALVAVDGALAMLDVYESQALDYWETFETRQDSARWRYAAYLDTRGWILHKLGRGPEAASSLLHSILIEPMPEAHTHLCLALSAMGELDSAFEQLVQATISREGSVPVELYEVQAELYAASGVWHVDGLEGYLQHRVDGTDEHEAAEGEREEPFTLLGEPLPFAHYQDLKGRQQAIAPAGRILLIDFWATWCGPCIQGMPHLQEVAQSYQDRGVEIMGLSVDADLDVVQEFFDVDFSPLYTVGWVGRDGFEIGQFSGIPSLFVVDTDGTIAEYIVGYGGKGDSRVEEAIEALLADDVP